MFRRMQYTIPFIHASDSIEQTSRIWSFASIHSFPLTDEFEDRRLKKAYDTDRRTNYRSNSDIILPPIGYHISYL